MPANPDDLLVLLTVARLGRFTAAADVLGVNHTTISRRIALLEKAIGGRVLVQTPGGWELTDLGRDLLGPAEAIERAVAEVGERTTGRGQLQGAVRVASPDGYAIHWLVPAVTRLQRDHPRLDLELITATQRAREARSGVDLEVVVGRPAVRRSAAEHLRDYRLQLYATRTYLDRAGTPTALADLGEHTLVYYIESALQVDDLDEASRRLPAPRSSLRSTSVFAHVAAVLADGGIGLLPDFLAEDEPTLLRVLPDYSYATGYWAVVRRESRRNPAVRAVLAALLAPTLVE
ncbi:LysR family transcriptional regulator [Barrientosiimonas humi]|uniref:LysR family transcriptional regulator n=1 Tax=Barrientosiimonas humi TaxID=999931 RepID=UPI00370D0CFF